MTTDRGAAETDVKIRSGRPLWMLIFVWGALQFVLAAGSYPAHRPWNTIFNIAMGCAGVALAYRVRAVGVDLTRDFVVVRSLRVRKVPWSKVQAVARVKDSGGTSKVQLVLEDGTSVTLQYPGGNGAAEYERDLQSIEHWWLAHRGASWHPVSPETPRPAD
jgi:hypothetical protein